MQVQNGAYTAKTINFATFKNFIDDANKAYPLIPSTNVQAGQPPLYDRDMAKGAYPFNWEYVTAAELRNSQLAWLEVSLEHDTPHIGEYATLSVYVAVENE